MNEFRADIHCHSTHSDGSDTPFEVLKKAKETGLKGLSITDHDTIGAYTPEFFSEAERIGIEILTGVELSSELEDTVVHVLGYGFDINSSSFRLFLVEIQERRNARNRAILAKLKDKKMPIEEEELFELARKSEKGKTVGRPHIAELMVRKGYVLTHREAFERYLKEKASCYVPGFKISPEDAIQQIKKARGKAVLAHPHFIKKGSILRKILGLPFDGIECYYAHLSKNVEKPWVKLAVEKGWIATGGSDYHGVFKPHISLGSSWVGDETFRKLKNESC